MAEHFPLAETQPALDEVQRRLLYRQVIEVTRCLEEGVLRDIPSGDIGSIFGWGFAPFTGGVLSYVDTVGAKAFVAEADRLAKTYGERFSPPQALRDMAAEGETYYPNA